MVRNLQSIQFMRSCAALLVVFFHSTQSVHNNIGGISEGFLGIAEIGASGVHIFFVISGFIMMYTSFYMKEATFSPAKFFVRRFIRIYPTYWLCCALYVLFHYFDGQGYGLRPIDIIASLFLLPGYSYSIIGPGWTLAYEIYFYVCFAFFMSFGLNRGFVALTIFFILSMVMGALFRPTDFYLRFFSNSLLIEFIFGSLIAYILIVFDNKFVSSRQSITLQGLAISAFAASYFIGYRNLPTFITWGIPSTLLIAGLVFNERRGIAWGFVKRCSFLGDSSYSLYLLHILLIDALVDLYKATLPAPSALAIPLCIAFTLLSAILAILFYNSVESKLTIWLRDLLRWRRPLNSRGLSSEPRG